MTTQTSTPTLKSYMDLEATEMDMAKAGYHVLFAVSGALTFLIFAVAQYGAPQIWHDLLQRLGM